MPHKYIDEPAIWRIAVRTCTTFGLCQIPHMCNRLHTQPYIFGLGNRCRTSEPGTCEMGVAMNYNMGWMSVVP